MGEASVVSARSRCSTNTASEPPGSSSGSKTCLQAGCSRQQNSLGQGPALSQIISPRRGGAGPQLWKVPPPLHPALGETAPAHTGSAVIIRSGMSHSLQSRGLQPARLLCPWRFLQARILEWVAMPSSRGSSQPRDRTQVSHIAGEFFTV